MQGLLGVRRARDRLGSPRRARSRRARPDLPLDGAHPVLAARGRALGTRSDRRGVPLTADHDARAALQPDEAESGRRARPRPHHPRGNPRRRPGQHRVPAGTRRAHLDDGPHLRSALNEIIVERRSAGPGGESSAWTSQARGRRRPLRLRADRADRETPATPGRRDHPRRRRGRRHGARRDRRRRGHLRRSIGHGILAAQDASLMASIRDLGITLEICPTSDLSRKRSPTRTPCACRSHVRRAWVPFDPRTARR